MIDLTTYRYALIVRDLVYKKQRHDENPNDTRFEWDEEFDLRILQDFSHFLNISVQPSEPNYFPQILASVQEIIGNYNQTANRNIPSPELKREYEEYLKKLEVPEKKSPLPLVLKRLYPGIDDSTLDLISRLSIARVSSPAVSLALPAAAQNLHDIGVLSGVSSPDTAALVALDTLSPELSQSPEFAQILSAAPAPLKDVATLLATSAVSGLTFVPTDTFPAILNSRYSPKDSQKISSQALSNQKQLMDFLSQAKAINQVGIATNQQLAKQAFLSGIPLSPTDQAVAATVLYNYVFPAVGYAPSIAPVTPASFSTVETVFARLGLNLYEKDHGQVKSSIRQAVTSFSISNSPFLFSQPVQTFYAARATPRLRDFYTSLAAPTQDPRLQEFFQTPLGSEIKNRFGIPSAPAPTTPQSQDVIKLLLDFISRFKINTSRLSQEPWFDAVSPAVLGILGFLSFGAPGGGAGIIAGEGVNLFRPGHLTRASNFASSASARLGSIFAKTGAAVVAGLSTALAVIALVVVSIPIVIALILFIINSSAFVVPPGGLMAGNFPGFINATSCPIADGYIHITSYNPAGETGHGSNSYWSDIKPECGYDLPQHTGCFAPTQGSSNVCTLKPNLHKCDIYGFAIDIFSSSGNNNVPVYLPQIDGKDAIWNFNGISFSNGHAGHSYGYTDSSGKYSLLFTHMKNDGKTAQNLTSGTLIGSLQPQSYTDDAGKNHYNTHLHLEFQIDGIYVKPDNYFCKK